ncbi:heavy-metal-associated domain-containing protein [Cellulosimicrobium cellulans]|uniref:heavy-metal-associated domain-containing protein n=1 Tax=Cellulosimicrobium cellulans TaxID=1710 RepID=UPI0020975FCC|nr:heavy-metal-associated domain-containing protein [Cellulosimicrobium cellulans]MCO7273708.1 heavy-metal-associated domain-containing protein [Cellulosimicrobium cellulans]
MSTVTTLGVTGMTCGNCVAHVTKDLEAVAGVENVSVELRVGGASEVTVFSDDPLDEAALREAVDEAGYEVASLEVQEDALAAQYAEQAAEKQEAHACACGCGTVPSTSADAAAPVTKTYDLQVPPRA